MRCWNCQKEIPQGAKACLHCEAPVQSMPTEEELKHAKEALGQMPRDVLNELQNAFSQSQSAEEFVNLIMTGSCPRCGSSQTGDCENDPEINEILVARCYDCGQFWCTECGKLLERDALFCNCWLEEDEEEGS